MSLYTLDIQLPQKDSGPILNLINNGEAGKHGKEYEVISSNLLYSDLNSSYYRLEIITRDLEPEYFKNLLGSVDQEIKFRIKEDLSLFERSLIEFQPRENLDFKQSFMTTSPAAVETARRCLLPQKSRLRELPLIGSRVGLISDGSGLGQPHQVTLELERDVFLLARYSGMQGFPLWTESTNEEHLIRTVCSLVSNFFLVRLSHLNREYAIDVVTRIQEQVDLPVIHTEYMETSITIAAILKNAARINGMDLKEKTAAVIGLNPAGHGLAELLFAMGLRRVYGIDSETRQLTRFERTEGIASSLDHVYEQTDFIFISPNYPVKLDERKFHEGQLIFSFTPGTLNIQELPAPVAKKTYQGNAPHPVFVLPGLTASIKKYRIERVDVETRLRFMETLLTREGMKQILPVPSTDLIKNQIRAMA